MLSHIVYICKLYFLSCNFNIIYKFVMDVRTIIDNLRKLPIVGKVLAAVAAAIALVVLLFFSSCGSISSFAKDFATEFDDMQIGANGTIKKQKTVSKTDSTTWYVEPKPKKNTTVE